MIIDNFSNNVLGLLTETVEVKERLSGINMVKYFNTTFTVIGFNYILKETKFFFNVENKVINNEVVIKDSKISTGDTLTVQYSY